MSTDRTTSRVERGAPLATPRILIGLLTIASAFATHAVAQTPPRPPVNIPAPLAAPRVVVKIPKLGVTPLGAANCRFGDRECNVCAPDVPGQFSRLGVAAHGISGRMRFLVHKGETLPPANQKVEGFDAHHHVEGLARIPDPAAPNWFVFSRATGKSDAGFLLAQMNRMSGNGGERMILGVDKNTYDHVDATGAGFRRFVTVGGTKHAGGVQILGKLLFVPFNCETDGCRPWVDVFDLSNKDNPDRVSRILLPNDKSKAFYASAVRLANGFTYVMVNRSNSADFDQYLSDSRTINHGTRWLYLGREDLGRFDGFYDRKHLNPRTHGIRGSISNDPFAYQNANFVTECGSGKIYLAALRQATGGAAHRKKWETDNIIDLFLLTLKTSDLSQISRIGEGSGRTGPAPIAQAENWRSPEANPYAGVASLQTIARGSRRFGAQSGCKMRGGASVYVSPTGKVIAYCGPHTGENGKLSFGEITADPPR